MQVWYIPLTHFQAQSFASCKVSESHVPHLLVGYDKWPRSFFYQHVVQSYSFLLSMMQQIDPKDFVTTGKIQTMKGLT